MKPNLRRLFPLLAAFLVILPLAAQGPIRQTLAAQDDVPAASQPGQSNLNADSGGIPLEADDLSAWLDGYIPYAIQRGQIPGAVVVVVKDGEVLVEKGYGYADLEARTPVDPETTLFRPGSVSKLFTWTAVMQQVEAGRLDLDEDVNTYLDFEIPDYNGEPITLRNILTHTAGFEESIRHLISNDPNAVMSLAEYVENDLPQRVFAPGSTPAYSNYATALAGRIVERVSGMSFDEYVDRNIFQPLGMTNSTFRQPLPEKYRANMSKGYASLSQPAQPFEIVIPAPAGSLSATGSDMAKFMIAHLNEGGPLLEPDTARLMHDYRAPGVGPLNTMALGFYEQQVNGLRALSHGGDTTLFHSNLWLLPEKDVGIYLSVNAGGSAGDSQAIRNSLLQRFADRYYPETREFTAVDEETAREHAGMVAGTYVASRGAFTNFMSLLGLLSSTTIEVGPDGDLLIPAFEPLSAGARDWVEIEPFVWRDRNTGERFAAEVEDGEVVRVSLDTLSPFTVYEPAPALFNPAWLVPALLMALAIIVLAAFAWPTRALVRRNLKTEFALTGTSLTAYRLSRLFAWLVILAVIGWVALVAIFSADIGAIGGPLDWLIQLLRALTPIAAFGLLGTATWHMVRCFVDRRRWTMKLGAALLVLAGLMVTWITVGFNLYGFGLVY